MADADFDVPFSPVSLNDFDKKLSAKEYEDRQKKTTTLELEKLLRSQELRRWKKRALHDSPVPLSKLLATGLGICILAFLLTLIASRSQVSRVISSLDECCIFVCTFYATAKFN